MNERFASLSRLRPASHINQANQVALAIDQEQCSYTVAKTMEPFNGREPRCEAGSSFDVFVSRGRGIVLCAEQKRPGRDAAVFVGRKRSDSEGLKCRGDSIWAD